MLELSISDLLVHTNVRLNRAVIVLFLFTAVLAPNAVHRADGQEIFE